MIRRKYSVTFHDGYESVRVKIVAQSIVEAVAFVCDTHAIPHCSVLDARRIR